MLAFDLSITWQQPEERLAGTTSSRLSELPLRPMLRVDKRALARRAADVTGGAR
jgi:hypothetical protein